MPLLESAKPSFGSGEISELYHGRHDFVRYDTGLKLCRDFVTLPGGGLTRRPPTEFIAEAMTDASVLVPFEFSRKDSYILEVGQTDPGGGTEHCAYFYRDGGRLEDPQNPGQPYKLDMPYLAADLPQLRFTKSGDIVYLMHPTRITMQAVQRFGDVDWRRRNVDFKNGPFRRTNTDDSVTLNPSTTTGSITVAATAPVFDAGHVGSYWQVDGKGVFKVTGVTDPQNVTADVTVDLPSATATATWAEGLFSTFRGWAETAAFHQQRFMVAKESILAGSALGDFENMEITGDADGAFSEPINSGTQRNNDIAWLSSGKVLSIGTAGEEYSLQGASLQAAVTATSLRIEPGPTEGSIDTDAMRVNANVLHVSKDGRRLQRLFFNFQVDDFQSTDLSIVSEHITAPGIQRIQWQRDPNRVLWVLLTNGELRAFTYNEAQELEAWHRHDIGAPIEDIAVIPSSDGTYDELWLIVRRTIEGGDKRYVERMLRYWDHEKDENDPTAVVFMDSQLSGTLTAGSDRILNLEHLEGETIDAVIGGNVVEGLVVLNGQAVIPEDDVPSEDVAVTAGYARDGLVTLLPRQFDFPDGPAEGRERNVRGLAIRFFAAPGVLVGDLSEPDLMESLHDWDTEEMDEPPKIFKGIKKITTSSDWGIEDEISIQIKNPFACIILSAPTFWEVEELD